MLKEACWINETTFWKPDDEQRENIVRSGRVQDVEDGLSEFPHVVLNQARVHDFYLDVMRKSPARLEPYYARRLLDLAIDDAAPAATPTYPVTVRLERIDAAHEGQIETVKARYVVGCDGARSTVRKSIGRALHGDSANHAWGVMDVLAVTDFPDIRFKCADPVGQRRQHPDHPARRRLSGPPLCRAGQARRRTSGSPIATSRPTTLIAAARRILQPHTLDVKEIAWWSVYEIGQRLCDKFDDVPEDEIADAACRACSSPATPATPTARRPGRA